MNNFRIDDKPTSHPSARAARADAIARLDPRSRVIAPSAKQARTDALDANKPTRSASARQARQDWIASLTNRTV